MEKVKVYKNGLTLIVSEGGANSASFAITIGTGSINETSKNNGISHYVEHMNFKGTDEYSSYDISNIMDSCGANYNAYTSVDSTCFYAQTIVEELEKTFSIMSANAFRSIYNEEECDKEKGVIIEEIYMSEDTPDDVCYDLSAKAYFGDNGYGRSVLGTAENVKSFTRQDILNYLKDYYVAENIVIAFAGNVDFNKADELVQKYVLPYVRSSSLAPTPAHSITSNRQHLTCQKDIEQVHFCLSFPSKSYLDNDKVKSEIANGVLGGGMSSRLFMKIREELGLAYSVYSFASRYKDAGTCSVYAGVNSNNYQKAFDAVVGVIDEMKKGVLDSEIVKVKNQIKASSVFAFEKPQSKVQIYSKHYLMTKEIYDPNQRLAQIDKVKKCDIDEVLSDFNFDQASSAIVGKNVNKLM